MISCSPNLGSSRKIQTGQRIHSSFVLAQTRTPYTPKASPPDDNRQFWEDLRSDGIQNSRKLLELDMFDYATARKIMRMFMHDSDKLKYLQQIATNGKPAFSLDYSGLELTEF